ncbi:MAG: hypothetical protein OSA99_20615 [Acidimicrobiales bacterium]|nr:hypothetical protein [Acidimicrobiales bacterium]
MAAGKVTDLRKRRIERLAVDLARVLVSTTYLIVEVAELDSVDEWRAAARLAARQRGWQVRTGFSQTREQVFAVRVDDEAEQRWSGQS